jgi:hypothetical protein
MLVLYTLVILETLVKLYIISLIVHFTISTRKIQGYILPWTIASESKNHASVICIVDDICTVDDFNF